MKPIAVFDKNDKLISVTFFDEPEPGMRDVPKLTPKTEAGQTAVELDMPTEIAGVSAKDFIERLHAEAESKLRQMKH